MTKFKPSARLSTDHSIADQLNFYSCGLLKCRWTKFHRPLYTSTLVLWKVYVQLDGPGFGSVICLSGLILIRKFVEIFTERSWAGMTYGPRKNSDLIMYLHTTVFRKDSWCEGSFVYVNNFWAQVHLKQRNCYYFCLAIAEHVSDHCSCIILMPALLLKLYT